MKGGVDGGVLDNVSARGGATQIIFIFSFTLHQIQVDQAAGNRQTAVIGVMNNGQRIGCVLGVPQRQPAWAYPDISW